MSESQRLQQAAEKLLHLEKRSWWLVNRHSVEYREALTELLCALANMPKRHE